MAPSQPSSLTATGNLALAPDSQRLVDPRAMAERLIEALGNNVTADILGVSRAQTSRWRSGKSNVSPEIAPRIVDLDHVLSRLLLELHPDEVGPWLTNANSFLGGAIPLDALRVSGAGPVLNAIDALAEGAYA